MKFISLSFQTFSSLRNFDKLPFEGTIELIPTYRVHPLAYNNEGVSRFFYRRLTPVNLPYFDVNKERRDRELVAAGIGEILPRSRLFVRGYWRIAQSEIPRRGFNGPQLDSLPWR